ncbi:coiled-coil domain-containing protein CG32809 isoform X10 [Rhagoletis pomonella]|uniref:coiled-coil domain-containing protein CG32809 isoform X10 n=1 Tax=Rhagoletis pomonella TaxID=28610 RepID=UPI00177DB081|nr:coiled-coil domain-containing protein CG32809 isoform X10 [Rhagoletis pomonella]
MLIRWKSKDKSSSNQSSSSSSSSKKKRKGREAEEDWQNESKAGRMPTNEQVSDHRRGMRRDDPRRHTLGGDMIMYAGNQGQQQQRAMDLEMSTRAQKNKKNNVPRGYTPLNQGPLFDDDPGIMSEVETASTGFRRGNKQRSSLPVVRTPSKTLERPLGLVFLQYRSETKRALLPNEITSIDTVRALFVRSFPRQLTMAYLEGPNVKIYIHDASKDMFYELEDVRSHLREIRDRSVLRLFESTEVAAPPQILPGGPGVPQPLPQVTPNHWDQDQSYFSEPEFDSDYKHQHIHKSKIGKQAAPYYVGASQTLPRGMYSSERTKVPIGAPVKPLRAHNSRGSMEPLFPYSPDQLYSIPDGYSSSPERSTRGNYEEPYYSQYGTRGPVVAPIIDEEQSEVGLAEDQYAVYGMKVGPGRMPRPNQMYDNARPEDLHRIRVEHMERQLANLTGLVQKALVNQHPQIAPIAVPTLDQNYLVVPTQCQADTKPTKPAIKSSTLPRTSSQAERDRLKPPPPPKPLVLAQPHQTYRADIALAPEVYNHLRGLQKKAKDLRMEVRTLRRLSQAQAVAVREDIKGTFMRIRATLLASSGTFWGTHQGDQDATRISREEELYKQEVIRLEKDLSDLEASVETLRGEVINRRTRVNMTAVEDMALVLSRASKTVAELKMKFPALSNGLRCMLSSEMERVVREEKFLKEEPDRLESALRRCKKLTGTLVTLKRLASVQEQRLPPNEPQINEEPPRSAEISNTDKPVPTPRMGSFVISGGPENALDALLDELQTFSKPLSQNNEARPDDSTSDESSQAVQSTVTTQISQARLYIQTTDTNTIPIQSQPIPAMVTGMVNTLPHKLNHNIANTNLANPAVAASLMMHTNVGSLRRLHSYPSGSDTDMSPPQNVRASTTKPPVPERTAELITKVSNKRIPPPPPPRTSSRSPLASPTNPNVPQQLPTVCESDVLGNKSDSGGGSGSGNSSGNESANDHVQRQVALEMRHQELLKKQKLLQEQYQRLQQMTKISGVEIGAAESNAQLQKTGSESNLQQKISFSIANAGEKSEVQDNVIPAPDKNNKTMQLVNNIAGIPDVKGNSGGGGGGNEKSGNSVGGSGGATTKQLYETEIL